MREIYYALVHSHLTYVIILWGRSKKTGLHPLQILQSRALRILWGFPPHHPNLETCCTSNIFPIQLLCKQAATLYVFNAIKKNIHQNFQFTLNKELHSYNTRNQARVHLEQYDSTLYGVNGLKNYLARCYNDIPDECRRSASLTVFKKQNIVGTIERGMKVE